MIGDDNGRFTNLLILLSFMDYFAVSMIAPQLSLWIRDMGASQFLIGVVGSSYGLIQLFSSTLVGMAADKYGRRVTLLVTLTMIMLAYMVMSLNTTVIGLLACRVVLGFFKHTQSCLKVIGGDINTGAVRAAFVSRMNSVAGAAFMLGPLVSAYYSQYTQNSYAYSALSCSAVFVLVLVLTSLYVKETLPSAKSPEGPKPYPGFITLVKRYKHLHSILLFRFFAATSVIIIRYFTPLYTQHYFGFDATHASYLSSFVGFSSILCSYSSSYIIRIVPDKYRLIKGLSALLTLSLVCTLLSSNMACLLITNLLLSFSTCNLRVIGDAVLLEGCGESDRGLVFGLGGSVVGVGRVIAPLVAGTLAEGHMMLPFVCSVVLSVFGTAALFTQAGDKVKSQ